MAFFSACTSSEVVMDESYIQADRFYYQKSLTPFTGTVVVYYKGSKQVKERRNYKEGLLNGLCTVYFKSGQLRIKGNYKDGLCEGLWEKWYENGAKECAVNYKADQLDGAYTTWLPDGTINEKGNYSENVRKGKWIDNEVTSQVVVSEL